MPPTPPAATAASAAENARKIVLKVMPQLDAVLSARSADVARRLEARTMEAHALLEAHYAEDVSEIKKLGQQRVGFQGHAMEEYSLPVALSEPVRLVQALVRHPSTSVRKTVSL
jgi:hypothetical protein